MAQPAETEPKARGRVVPGVAAKQRRRANRPRIRPNRSVEKCPCRAAMSFGWCPRLLLNHLGVPEKSMAFPIEGYEASSARKGVDGFAKVHGLAWIQAAPKVTHDEGCVGAKLIVADFEGLDFFPDVDLQGQ